MKRILVLVLALLMLFSSLVLTGCDDDDDTSKRTRRRPTTTAPITTTTNRNTQATTKKPEPEPFDPYNVKRTDGVIDEQVTKTIMMYEVDPETFGVGAKYERKITFKGTIKIGNTAASTGAFASVGLPFNMGLDAYINKINYNGGAGGDYDSDKMGYYIDIIHYDDGFDAAVGSSYTKKLVEEDKVFALVGHFGSPTVGATIDYIKETGVIACYFASGVGTLFNANATATDYGSTLFPVQPIYTTEGRIMVGRIIQQYPDAKKIGVVYTNDEAGVGISDGAQAQIEALGYGYECVLSETYTDATDYTSAVNKVKDCDVIIVAGIQKGTVGILKAMIANGIYKPVFTSYSVASSQTLIDIKSSYDKLSASNKFPIYANAWLSSTDLESFAEFGVDIIAYTGENTLTLNSYAMAGWIAASVFCEGVERVFDNGKELTNLTFVEAMESAEVQLKMGSGSHGDTYLDYSDGFRLGTTTMALLKSNSSCNLWEEAEGMEDFLDFMKSGSIYDIP